MVRVHCLAGETIKEILDSLLIRTLLCLTKASRDCFMFLGRFLSLSFVCQCHLFVIVHV